MLKFTGQAQHDGIDILIPYRETHDVQLTHALTRAMKVLATAVQVARGQDLSAESEDRRWMKEFLVGFGLLGIGEARSILLLLSDNLSRHARVHLRSLYEYELKSKSLIRDPSRALKFRDALAYEMRTVAAQTGGAFAGLIEQQIAEALGVRDSRGVIGSKESEAFGGTARNQMKDEPWPEKRYVGTFAWPSMVSHGSILVMRELARSVDGVGSDVLSRAVKDGHGNDILYQAGLLIVKLSLNLGEQFGVNVAQVNEVMAELIAANQRLGLISLEQEAAAEKALVEHSTRRKSKSQ
jgi:hypothetical protein